MKLSFVFLLLLSAAIFSGCTHNLSKSDFENESLYYKEVNSLAEGRAVRLETKDSTFTAENVKFDGDQLNGVIKQTLNPFTWNEKTIEKTFTVPASELKSISLTKRTSSISKGALIGMLAGVTWGGTFFDMGSESNSGHSTDYLSGAIITGLAGTIIGGITGLIVGDDYVFSTQDRLSCTALFSDNSVHKYGLKFGYHSGFNTGNFTEQGRSNGNIHSIGERKPGISVTFFYNYPLGKNFSLNSELSYISAGSNEVYSAAVPIKNDPIFFFNTIEHRSVENVKLIELAPLIRLNLAKGTFTPYFLIGPKFAVLIPPANSQKEKYFSDINNQYGGNDFSVSASYKNFFWAGVVGAGFSTGKLFPYEILFEARYCIDGSNRFIVHSYALNYWQNFPDSRRKWDVGQRSSEIIFNVGIAAF